MVFFLETPVLDHLMDLLMEVSLEPLALVLDHLTDLWDHL